MNILQQLEQKIASGFFEKNEYKYLYLFQEYDYDIGKVFIDIDLLDKKQEKQNKYNQSGNYVEELDFVTKLLRNFVLEKPLCNPEILKK